MLSVFLDSSKTGVAISGPWATCDPPQRFQ